MPILGGTGNASEYAYRSYLIEIPDPFDWVDVTNASPAVEYRSGYAKIKGIKSSLPLRVSIGSSYSLIGNVFDNGQTVTFDNNDINQASFDEYTDPNNRFKPGLGLDVINEFITNNTSINLSKTVSVSTIIGFNNPYEVLVGVGKTVQDWIVTTRPIDDSPTPFAFNPVTSAETSTSYESNSIVLSGLESGYTFTSQIISGIGTLYVNNIPRGSTFNVSDGDSIKLQTQSPDFFNTSNSLVYRVGTYTTSWIVTTESENQNITFTPSDFTDQTNLQINTSYTSNQITLSGFSKNSTLPVSLSNSNTLYEVERGGSIVKSFTASPIEVINNDKIRLRLTSSNSYSTTISTMLTVGITTADWRLATTSPPPPTTVTFTLSRSSPFDNQIIFTKQTGDGISLLTFGVIPDGSRTVNYNISFNATYLMTSATGTVGINSSNQIALNDSGGDLDFNDLIVTCSTGTFYSSGGLIYYNL